MKKFVLLISIVCCVAVSFWCGAQYGQRQNWLLMNSIAITGYISETYDYIGPELPPEIARYHDPEIRRLITSYGRYLKGDLPFHHGALSKSDDFESFYRSAIARYKKEVDVEALIEDYDRNMSELERLMEGNPKSFQLVKSDYEYFIYALQHGSE